MISGILACLTALLDGDETAESENSRFIPSRLDASVRDAHGGSGEEIERELARIEATARYLEDHHREH